MKGNQIEKKYKYIALYLEATIRETRSDFENLIDDANSAIDALNELESSYEAPCSTYIEYKAEELKAIVEELEKVANKLSSDAKDKLSHVDDEVKEVKKYGEY